MTLVGQTINGYEFLEGVATGGFSEVYRVRRVSDDVQVAIKRIDASKITDDSFEERFKIEAQVVADLDSPHILPVYGHWNDDHGMFMVMQWMSNGSLRRRIDAGGVRDIPQIEQWVRQIGSALQTTHDAGLIHRDVKPDNIMFDDENNACLADFGLAKDTTRDQPLTQMGWKLGSQAYSSPEQISNDGDVSPQSDIFAFGVTLFETLTGKHPFIDGSADNIKWMIKALREPMPLVQFIHPEIPAYIDDILQQATQKDPADRYQSVTDMVQAFTQLSSNTDKPPTTSSSSTEKDDKQPDTTPKKGLLGRFFGRS